MSLTPLRVVPNVEPYLEAFAEGALDFASDHGTKPEQVATIAGLCLHETHGGVAPGYRRQAKLPASAADGTGDWSARTGAWTTREGVLVLQDSPTNRELLRRQGWSLPTRKADGKAVIVPGPYAIPADGLGWGRGLLQLDALGDFHAMFPGPGVPWPVDRQAYAACALLNLARQQLRAYADHPLFERALTARYNTTAERVIAGLQSVTPEHPQGQPDLKTTGGDYSADVLALSVAVRARWPDRFRSAGGVA